MSKKLKFVRAIPGGWTRESEQIGPDGGEWTHPREVPEMTNSNTIFVAKHGNDVNAGTREAPVKTVRHGMFRARGYTWAGGDNYDVDGEEKEHVCILDSGVYDEVVDDIYFHGGAARLIAAPGEAPTIRYDIAKSARHSPNAQYITAAADISDTSVIDCIAPRTICYNNGKHYYFDFENNEIVSIPDDVIDSGTHYVDFGEAYGVWSIDLLSPYDSTRLILQERYNDRQHFHFFTESGGLQFEAIPYPTENSGGGLHAYGMTGNEEKLYVHFAARAMQADQSAPEYSKWQFSFYDKESMTWGRYDFYDIYAEIGALMPDYHNNVLLAGDSVLFFVYDAQTAASRVLRARKDGGNITGVLPLPRRAEYVESISRMDTGLRPALVGDTVYVNLPDGVYRLVLLENGGIDKIKDEYYSGFYTGLSLISLGAMLAAIDTRTITYRRAEGKPYRAPETAHDIVFPGKRLTLFLGAKDEKLPEYLFLNWSIGERTIRFGCAGDFTPCFLRHTLSTDSVVSGLRIDGANIANGYHYSGASQKDTLSHCEIADTIEACTRARVLRCIVRNSRVGIDTSTLCVRNVIQDCGVGIRARGNAVINHCTVALCKTGVALADNATITDSIVTGNTLDIIGDNNQEIGSNVFRTSEGVVRTQAARKIADLPLFADYEAKDFSLRDRARGYPYDSPGVLLDDSEDYGAYPVRRVQHEDEIDLDEVTDWLPTQMQCDHSLAQLATQDTITGGIAVQHCGYCRSWTLSWSADEGASEDNEKWEAHRAILTDLYRECAAEYRLLFGFAENDNWAIERSVTATTGGGDLRTLRVGANQYIAPSVMREWARRYICIGDGAPVRVQSVTRTLAGITLTTEEDAYTEQNKNTEQVLHLLELWRVAVDPRRALSSSRQAAWAATSYTGLDLSLREVET